MIRFCKQPSIYSCGPTAIINVAKWLGESCSVKKHHTAIARICKSTYELGTETSDFERVLRSLFRDRLVIKKRVKNAAREAIDHLKQPKCAVAFLYWHVNSEGDIQGHYIFLLPEGKKIRVINDASTETVMTKHDFRLRVRLTDGESVPEAWLLRVR